MQHSRFSKLPFRNVIASFKGWIDRKLDPGDNFSIIFYKNQNKMEKSNIKIFWICDGFFNLFLKTNFSEQTFNRETIKHSLQHTK